MQPRAEEFVAQSAVMRSVVARARTLAPTDVTVCIVGEPGTGKTRIASALHAESHRAQRPLHVVRGDAFAARDFDAAMGSGGTVVLAAVDALSSAAQSHVLRAIKANASASPNVRVITTSTQDLDELADRGGFDAELARRMAVTRVDVPPLRARAGDVERIARQFAHRWAKATTPEVEAILAAYDWPGNLGELEKAIEAASHSAGATAMLRPEHLPQSVRAATGAPRQRTAIPSTLRAQVDALRAEGLVAAMTDEVLIALGERHGSSVIEVLLAYYASDPARRAQDHFLLHDARFAQETDDVVGELSALLGSPPLFTQIAAEKDVLTVRGPNGEERIHLDAGLDDVVYHFNQTLAQRDDRRIVQLTTQDSRLAYIALSTAASARLRGAGIPLREP